MAVKREELYDTAKFLRYANLESDPAVPRILAEQCRHLLDGGSRLDFPVELRAYGTACFSVRERRGGTAYEASLDLGDLGWFASVAVATDGRTWYLEDTHPYGPMEHLRDEALSLAWNLHRSQVPADSRTEAN